MVLSAIKVSNKLLLTLQLKPSIAFFETLIIVISNGIITGKLSMAVKEKLLLLLEAMAAVNVSVHAIDVLPIMSTRTNNKTSCIKLPIKRV